MSVRKFEAMVDKMVQSSPQQNYAMANRIAELFKVIYSELMSKPATSGRFYSKLARKNIGKRRKPLRSRF